MSDLKKSFLSGAVIAALTAVAAAAGTARAANFEFHGDLNNRFLGYTDQGNFFAGGGTSDQGSDETFGEIKYRMWTSAESDEGGVKGVFAIEIGGMRFGRRAGDQGSGRATGGEFSGDSVNIETRWAYTDIGFPINPEHRVKVGLQPYAINPHFWQETASGVQFSGPVWNGKYSAGWARGFEAFLDDNDIGDDLDNFFGRYDFKPMGTDAGVFVVWQTANNRAGTGAIDVNRLSARGYELKTFTGDMADVNIVTFGTDGKWKGPGNGFFNWHFLYQIGDINGTAFTGTNGTGAAGNFDLSAFLGRVDIGTTLWGNTKVTLTGLYASGDDNPNDNDFDAFLATDMDNFDSIIFTEDGMTDDFFLVETPYLFDKGWLLIKGSIDHKATQKLSLGGAVAYVALAEDLTYVDSAGVAQAEDVLGIELSGRLKYMIYPSLEFQTTLAYLVADDAMDFFEVDAAGDPLRNGSADEDIVHLGARLRYKF